jgi:hypothetical protein
MSLPAELAAHLATFAAHEAATFKIEVSAHPAITIIARKPQGPVIVPKALLSIGTAERSA